MVTAVMAGVAISNPVAPAGAVDAATSEVVVAQETQALTATQEVLGMQEQGPIQAAAATREVVEALAMTGPQGLVRLLVVLVALAQTETPATQGMQVTQVTRAAQPHPTGQVRLVALARQALLVGRPATQTKL